MSNKTEILPEEKTKKSKSNNNDDNIIYTSFLETEDYILEQIINTTHTTYTTWNPETEFCQFDKVSGTIGKIKNFTYRNKVYQPIVDELVINNVVLLPGMPVDYGSEDKLVDEIKEFLFQYFEVPKFFESFLPYLILFYWVYDRFPFIPYLHFLGRTGTGKSTAMEVLGSICYKPIDASGAITMASIFRIASLWKGTLLLDEFNPGGDSYKEMLSLLKSGVSNKAVLRVEGDKKREVKTYMVKSPKIFTSEKPITDAGLRSRVLEIKMEINKIKMPLYRQKRYLDKALDLRNKLLMWRLNKLSKVDLSVIEFGFKELQGFQGRVQQVITPIYYMANDEAKVKIAEFAKEQQEETLSERRESLDGQIFEIILSGFKRSLQPTLSAITESINTGSKFPITERKIGSVIRKILGFNIERRGDQNISTIVIEKQEERISELCEYYGLDSGFDVVSVVDVVPGTSYDTLPDKTINEIFGIDK